MAREIVLDTETTGLDPKRGHRLIEIGCIEIEDLMPTGNSFYHQINPERDIEPDAIRIHGITDAMVAGKPKFSAICDELLAFVGESKIIAHNAAFDRGFVNMEFERLGRVAWESEQWIDSLDMARNKFPGMSNSLDALCKRFNISLSDRDKHGALIDAQLLACVYLELQGGKERGLDLSQAHEKNDLGEDILTLDHGQRPRLMASRITQVESQAHEAFVLKYLKDKSLWNLV